MSCPSAAFCAEVDDNGDASLFDGVAWSHPRKIIQPGTGGLISVSCASAGHCATVSDTDAVELHGRRWTRPELVDPEQAMSSVSCPLVSFCVAVGNFGEALTYSP